MFQFKNGRFYANVACGPESHTLSFTIPIDGEKGFIKILKIYLWIIYQG